MLAVNGGGHPADVECLLA